MAFIKNMWRGNSKHKKLCEEWALATSLRDLGASDELANENNENSSGNGDETVTFSVKYLGNTAIEAARSEQATADAVKTVIAASKAANGKKVQRVNFEVSPKGIVVTDALTDETMLEVSIYRISYCSADAAHDHVFAFVGSIDGTTVAGGACKEEFRPIDETSSSSDDGTLMCHVFACQKRKMAQVVAIAVARSFDTAYQLWQEATEKRKHNSKNESTERTTAVAAAAAAATADTSPQIITENNSNSLKSLLIDFNSDLTAEICAKDHRTLFQNTWVSFEDDTHHDVRGGIKERWEQNVLCS